MLLTKLIKVLKQPHPAHDQPWIYLRTIGIISVCIFLIIWLMAPFDTNLRYGRSVAQIAAIYSIGGFVCMGLNYSLILLFPKAFAQRNWTLGKEILILIYELSTVAVVVAFLSSLLVKPPFEPISYPKAWLIVFVEGILPYLIAVMIKHIYLLKKNLAISQSLNGLLHGSDFPPNEFRHENQPCLEGLPFSIFLKDFLYTESKGNYLFLNTDEGGTIRTYSVRMTIKEFCHHNHQFSDLFRCHRAFVINTSRVQHIEGNAAGYQLTLPPATSRVYVSRQNIEKFKERLRLVK